MNRTSEDETSPSKSRVMSGTASDKILNMFAEHDGQLMMLELQGNIETSATTFEGLELGRLEFQDRPYLYIANHRIEGKVVNLDKPLAVLRTRNHASSNHDSTPFTTPRKPLASSVFGSSAKKTPHRPLHLLNSSSPPSSHIQTSSPVPIQDPQEVQREKLAAIGDGKGTCNIVAIIRKKIVFKNRPEPIIS